MAGVPVDCDLELAEWCLLGVHFFVDLERRSSTASLGVHAAVERSVALAVPQTGWLLRTSVSRVTRLVPATCPRKAERILTNSAVDSVAVTFSRLSSSLISRELGHARVLLNRFLLMRVVETLRVPHVTVHHVSYIGCGLLGGLLVAGERVTVLR